MLNTHVKTVLRAPQSRPPFTFRDVKQAIPPHCFKRSVPQSFSYLLLDIAISFSLYYISAKCITEPVPSQLYFLISWITYSLLQGCVLLRIWIIGHECGHHAFSDYEWLDDVVGFILHSFLPYPYFSFKYSHRHHHSKTRYLHHEELDSPMLKSQVPSFFKHLTNPAARLLAISSLLVFGLPTYLLINFRSGDHDRFAFHFNPFSQMFSRGQHAQILPSDAGVLAMSHGLHKLASIKGFAWIAFVYGGPYLTLNALLMVAFILNHTHPFVPYYDSSEWDWLRGSLATIDRDFGIFNMVFHNATKTHVAHHLFPGIPHYHAEEATRAMKPILGEHYQYDDTPFYQSLWSTIRDCVYVEED